jgi:hypothetical protein
MISDYSSLTWLAVAITLHIAAAATMILRPSQHIFWSAHAQIATDFVATGTAYAAGRPLNQRLPLRRSCDDLTDKIPESKIYFYSKYFIFAV